MGGDDSQKLLPWRGTHSSPGHSRPPAYCKFNTLPKLTIGIRAAPISIRNRSPPDCWVTFAKPSWVTSRECRRGGGLKHQHRDLDTLLRAFPPADLREAD